MTARATITAAAMSRAIAAAKEGVRVIIEPDGRTIIESATEPRQDAPLSAYDEWRAKRGQSSS